MTKRKVLFCMCGDHAWTPLTRGYAVIVSPQDAEEIAAYSWHAFQNQAGSVYAARKVWRGGSFYLHRRILDAPRGLEVDHIDGNGLDNRRHNIRLASKSQNAANRKRLKNTSGFRGVSLAQGPYHLKKQWVATIKKGSIGKKIGYFSTPEEAARAYDSAARQYFGEYASLNFSDEREVA